MATTTLAEAIDEGLTLWVPVKAGQAVTRDLLAKALYEGLVKQVQNVDDVLVEKDGAVTIYGDGTDDAELTPGGDDAFAELVRMIESPSGGTEFFYHSPGGLVHVAFDLGLSEVRIS